MKRDNNHLYYSNIELLQLIRYNSDNETFVGKRLWSKYPEDVVGATVPDAYITHYTPFKSIRYTIEYWNNKSPLPNIHLCNNLDQVREWVRLLIADQTTHIYVNECKSNKRIFDFSSTRVCMTSLNVKHIGPAPIEPYDDEISVRQSILTTKEYNHYLKTKKWLWQPK